MQARGSRISEAASRLNILLEFILSPPTPSRDQLHANHLFDIDGTLLRRRAKPPWRWRQETFSVVLADEP